MTTIILTTVNVSNKGTLFQIEETQRGGVDEKYNTI